MDGYFRDTRSYLCIDIIIIFFFLFFVHISWESNMFWPVVLLSAVSTCLCVCMCACVYELLVLMFSSILFVCTFRVLPFEWSSSSTRTFIQPSATTYTHSIICAAECECAHNCKCECVSKATYAFVHFLVAAASACGEYHRLNPL